MMAAATIALDKDQKSVCYSPQLHPADAMTRRDEEEEPE